MHSRNATRIQAWLLAMQDVSSWGSYPGILEESVSVEYLKYDDLKFSLTRTNLGQCLAAV